MSSRVLRFRLMAASTFSFHPLGACRNSLVPFDSCRRPSSSIVSFTQCLKFNFPISDLTAKFSSSTLIAQPCVQAESSSSLKPTIDSGDTGFKRPEVIEWQKNLSNRVELIGRVGRDVDIRYLDSGKVVANSLLRVPQYPSKQSMWITLEFWDELAEIAAAHLKQNDCIYISGPVFVETYMGKDDLQKTICKVKPRDLKYVHASNLPDLEGEVYDQIPSFTNKVEEQWQEYFANPSQWWDNRTNKRNPSSPDFKNKTSGTALWISSWSTPSWVKARLEEEGQRPTSEASTESETLWQAFFANPSEWWDNRDMKKSFKSPDFRHKTTKEALWIESYSCPAWVKSQLAALDSKLNAARQMQDGKKVEWISPSKGIDNRRSSFQEEDLNFF